ncbi:Peptidyl-tRNA hydrolase [Thelohanellus kitauei]|uniref:peptidyl-tRNA hydrolase n=1 Tax=Thelohanellus kitauei TaxID=669202 RepID=A0A0C2MI44_THEKT|nr:Peptidyl-tRNA hydrolase [Thelohanellus kitauei]
MKTDVDNFDWLYKIILGMILTRRELLESLEERFKRSLVIIVIIREDLGMSTGKMAAQCCHALLGCFTDALEKSLNIISKWEDNGELFGIYTSNIETLSKVATRVIEYPRHLIRDAGRTQVRPGTITALAFGPIEAGKFMQINQDLQLVRI